ncbi:cobalt-precorrin-6A synthase [Rhodospirillum rubrum F11]|uniref:Cobalt-precorrin-5B C(1)-methyltransferase n=3 Tax=Rhodospirillum rubrum TaxID=1085 RepID=CBID_RHORT|nr:cobalt-precorrin-5B (C(1))-methyltransferase [Rhodospirillum rubrum]Q8GDE1.1 RecName: Full=Cobalt-precorrin-5B C(1)-methyltransferase; AltName: Full=Cobalt-precorrin-6A synthase [Rhodospirillum rubrum ATCC 11170]AAN75025.1 CbiD [Rhodospirillum rubrum ATCC 11170]ABC23791.1 Cobalamin (vitamin B12) biosynthesis CbiD protein [Rhodospirillum rubrum ATCC 11170]AEO49531.1 cobalt-precorrin-6A synthase [Rhodospirillum rubrum F11]QXG79741.1 cobalt-precorrin-5B (C(1))-methyltransferase [Rhodospirillum
MDEADEGRSLRRGWTTGACATAALKAALEALVDRPFPDPVALTLPRGERPAFALATRETGPGWARAGVIKDAGDDPDVTHGALIEATARLLPKGSGLIFRAGSGVGTVTKPGLPLAVGEPAINPVPRAMMTEVATAAGLADLEISIAVAQGASIALRTWNPRLGILGGLSILGTTGVVVPYSCSAWIHSIRRGVDVARATGRAHVVGTTGATSERAALDHLGLDAEAVIDMGDFVGGLLKYLRDHPIPHLTIAGGFAKLSKLADGALDLHSKRAQVDIPALARRLAALGATQAVVSEAERANTALEVLTLAQAAGLPLATAIAFEAATVARAVLGEAPVRVSVLVVDRGGRVVGEGG